MPPLVPNSLSFTENIKKIRVLRNGDCNYRGVLIAVRPNKYATLTHLLHDATKCMRNRVYIPNSGFDTLYTLDGTKVSDLHDLEHGGCYACSGPGETFKYAGHKHLIQRHLLQIKENPRLWSKCSTHKTRCEPDTFPARIITIIRNGPRPRRIFQHLLNNRNARSLEQALTSITRLIKLDSGAVRKVFNQAACQITSLKDFFGYHHVFFAYGHEVAYYEDFVLDRAECNALHYNVFFRSNNASPVCKHLSLMRFRSAHGSSPEIPRQIMVSYEVGRVIGEGGFGIVRECTSKAYRQNGMKYAMKIINKSKCSATELENEVMMLSRLSHPNIMRVFNAYDSPTHLYLIMELMEGGDLAKVIDAGKTPENVARRMSHNIASALFYLHSLLIIHRDVKPDNFLIGVDKCGNKVLKLSDFGFATPVTKSNFKGSGTPFYMAPERLREEEYDYKVDTWAAGITIYLLLTARFPFGGEGDECYRNIKAGTYNKTSVHWEQLSDDAKDIIGTTHPPQFHNTKLTVC